MRQNRTMVEIRRIATLPNIADLRALQRDAPRNINTLLGTMSQAELARSLGVNYATLWRWQVGRTTPDICNAILLAKMAADAGSGTSSAS